MFLRRHFKMTNSNIIKLKLIFRVIALILLIVGFLFLFVKGDFIIRKETYGHDYVNSDRVVLEEDCSYDSEDFFVGMRRLHYFGEETILEWIGIVSYGLSLLYIITSFFVKSFKKIGFCILPLITLGLFIAILINSNTIIGVDFESLGYYYGYDIYTTTSIEFDPVLVPSIVFIFLTFVSMLTCGILEILNKKSQDMIQNEQNSIVECFGEVEHLKYKEELETMETHEVEVIATELKKLKELLDAGIITQEEFDAKKKQLLGL